MLGISVTTLYAYVSRGMLRSAPDANNKRRLYDADEVRRLARRKAGGKRGKVLDWGVRNRAQINVLRAALVACADHELNASMFTVRFITSMGTHLFSAVAGGLAALSGPRHGGEPAGDEFLSPSLMEAVL